MANEEKFDNKGKVYDKARPSYPKECMDWIISQVNINNSSVIADIGSGTGIFTKLLLGRNYRVYGVEPNESMRLMAERNLNSFNKFYSVNGTSENTQLKGNTIDLITVAQAFHWFEVEGFKKECKRILRINGKVVLIWNNRKSDTRIVEENAEIFRKYCQAFNGFSGIRDKNKVDEFFGEGNYIKKSFENDLVFSKENFIKRACSASQSLMPTDKSYDEYINSLERLFNKYQQNDEVLVPNETVVYIGTV